jgi:hypothetical protein
VTQVRNDTPGTGLLPTQARRGQDPQGSAAGAQTPDRQDRPPAPGRRRASLSSGEPGRAEGTTRSPARPALHPEAGSSDKPLPDPTTTLRPARTPLDTNRLHSGRPSPVRSSAQNDGTRDRQIWRGGRTANEPRSRRLGTTTNRLRTVDMRSRAHGAAAAGCRWSECSLWATG